MSRQVEIEHYKELIRKLDQMRKTHEITQEKFDTWSIAYAREIAALEAADEPNPSPDLNSAILRVVEMAERNPAVVHAIAFGIIAAVGHYVRSQSKED